MENQFESLAIAKSTRVDVWDKFAFYPLYLFDGIIYCILV